MKKDTAKTVLKVFGIIHFILAVMTLFVGVIVLANVVPDLAGEAAKSLGVTAVEGIDVGVVAGITFIISAMWTAFEGFALLRASKGKTTLALVLEIISIIGCVVSMIGAFNVSSIITLLIDALVLYSILVVRKDA